MAKLLKSLNFVIALGSVSVLAVGCGSSSKGAPVAPPRAAAISGLGPLGAYLPIDAQDHDTLRSAARVIVNDCLRPKRLALSVAPIEPTQSSFYQPYETTEPADWGSDNVAEASHDGLWQRVLVPKRSRPQPEPWTVAAVPSEQQAVYAAIGETNGAATTGCWKQVRERIGDASERYDQEVADLIHKAWDVAQTSSKGSAALSAWSRCLSSAGYPNVIYAVKEPEFDLQLPPTPQEISFAIAEAKCSAQTRMTATLAKVDTQIEKEYAQQYSSQLWAAYEEGQRRVAAARRVLATGG